MKLTFIANACCIYQSNGFKLLCDPWLTDGAFYGSWFHYPPLRTIPSDVADYNALYISHLHPDHFDPETLSHFDKSKPLIILDSEPNYLEKMARKEGFTNILKIPDGHTRQIGPFTLTMFKPFVNHPFFECELGNIVDSALVVDDGTYKVFNANDNTPDLESARMLREKFGRFDIAQLNYNAAGPYPSCFNVDRKLESNRIIKRNLDHVVELCKILEPKLFVPFAGEFTLGGRNHEKDSCSGTTTPEFAAGYVSLALPDQEACAMDEQGYLDLSVECVFFSAQLADEPYTYESDSLPAKPELDILMRDAIANLKRAQERFHCYPACRVIINDRYIIELGTAFEVKLKCTLDPALLFGILNRKYHWNNAEIGCHIEFERTPNEYQPDVHTLLSYLHA
jgi:UDP-MurNAc hydroxylase